MEKNNPFSRLEPDAVIPNFDCGDTDLNDFFLADASKWQKNLLAVTKNYRRQPEHWGTKAMDYIKHWMTFDNKTGCCFLTVDAYPSAVPFYRKNGFCFLGKEEEQNYLNSLKNDRQHETVAMYFHLKSLLN